MHHDPLLLIAFNRPEHLSTLIDRLRLTKPTKIYVAIDGPRDGNQDDLAAVGACHEVVDAIDWDAEVITQFQTRNLGCGNGVSAALSWFFTREERGIILEDDVLPQNSFFGFCTELLDRYQHDERVLAISGCNFVPPEFQTNPANPYRFSRVPHIWGWATWRRAWSLHSLDMTDWRQRLPARQLWDVTGRSPQGFMFWRAIFNLMAQEKIDTWDMQFVFEGMARNMLTATSNTNLIDNVGFGSLATHTHEQPPYLRPSQDIELPVRDVPIEVDERADAWSRKVVFGASTRGLVEQAIRYLRQRD
jgi:hypothetical protein